MSEGEESSNMMEGISCKPENFIDDKLHMKVANFMEKDQLENLRLEFSFEC